MSCVIYQRRQPENTVLYSVIQQHLETFLERARDLESGSPLPRFVAQEFADYLRCAILALGFARVRCEECGDEKLVGFSWPRWSHAPARI